MLRSFVALAEALGIDYNIIEAYDQPWKTFEGGVGPYWGVFDTSRHPKFSWTGPITNPDHWKLAGIAVLMGVLLALPILSLAGATASHAAFLAGHQELSHGLLQTGGTASSGMREVGSRSIDGKATRHAIVAHTSARSGECGTIVANYLPIPCPVSGLGIETSLSSVPSSGRARPLICTTHSSWRGLGLRRFPLASSRAL